MLTPPLQKRLDEKWNNCWPVSDLRPLALLDLISYLFFIKKLDDSELIHQSVKSSGLGSFIYTREIEEFTWSHLQTLDARAIQHLFNKENGVIDLMSHYAQLGAPFSDCFKAPLLIDPTPKLIGNAVEIINIIETSDKVNQGAIVDYLFSRSKITAQNGHEFLPDPISKLMISVAAPVPGDPVLDPCAGNGSLMVNAYRYMADSHNLSAIPPGKLQAAKVSGVESDLVQLRLAAMNLVLHGVRNPDLHFTPVTGQRLNQKPAVVVSNLLFGNDPATAGKGPVERETLVVDEMADNLDGEGRAVILLPQHLLKSDSPAAMKMRKKLVEQFSLEAVISLAPKTESLFSSAAVLVFKAGAVTGETWFCKWGAKKKRTLNEALADQGNGAEETEMNEVLEIINKWKNRNDRQRDPSGNSFFIAADYLRTNNYRLSFNDYKLIRQEEPAEAADAPETFQEREEIMAAKKENLHEFFETSPLLPKRKRRSRLAPVLVIITMLLLGAGAYYWFCLRDNHHHLYTRSKSSGLPGSRKVSNAAEMPRSDSSADFPRDSTASPVAAGFTNNSTDNSVKYTVVNRAWFHYQPDSARRKPVFLEPRKDLVLTPKVEKNGFVYVVYVNSKGAVTHGWLDKKDLEAVE